MIRVRHIPGKFNILADPLSRLDRPLKTEWTLDQSVANSIFQMLNYPNVDLFATRFNHKLPLYEGESISNQPNLFPVELHLFFFDVIAL